MPRSARLTPTPPAAAAKTGVGMSGSTLNENDDAESGNAWAYRTLKRYKLLQKEDGAEVDLPVLIRLLAKIGVRVAGMKVDPWLDEALRALVILFNDVEDTSPATQVKLDAMENAKMQEGRVRTLADRMEEVTRAGEAQLKKMEETTAKLTAAAEEALGRREGGGRVVGDVEGMGRTSYADAMKNTPARHAEAVARVEMRQRQVVLDKPEEAGADPLQGLNEKEVLAKAQLAVEMMANEGEKEAEGVKFLHARKTAKGGAILVTRTIEAARWLRGEAVISRFAEKMGGVMRARADLCLLVAEYVPIAFEPDVFTAFAQVERDSGLQQGAIREARYIKKRDNRAEGQRYAHMIIGMTDPTQANLAIINGMVIEGKLVSLRKHKIDPRRCMKCQQIGATHLAATCKSIHEACARCAGMHRSSTCTVKEVVNFKCVNCKVKGHGAADRNCPAFKAKLKETHTWFAEYAYRLFPTKDPETWEREVTNEADADGDRGGWETQGRTGANRGKQGGQGGAWRGGERTQDQGWGTRRGKGRVEAQAGGGEAAAEHRIGATGEAGGGARPQVMGAARRLKQGRLDDMLQRKDASQESIRRNDEGTWDNDGNREQMRSRSPTLSYV